MEDSNNKYYFYARISSSHQRIDRQIENAKRAYPQAYIFEETYTGTKSNRPVWKKLLSIVKSGDTIVFDSVSRMSRNADEGFKTYMDLYNAGINLIFLKESTINTDSYRSLADGKIKLSFSTNDADADEFVNDMLACVSKYISKLAEKQIRLAFEQAQKEVTDLHQRTSEGMRQAKMRGERIGRQKGDTVTTKKSIEAKKLIKQYHKLFGGSLNDIAMMDLIRGKTGSIARNTYYQYKRQLKQEVF